MQHSAAPYYSNRSTLQYSYKDEFILRAHRPYGAAPMAHGYPSGLAAKKPDRTLRRVDWLSFGWLGFAFKAVELCECSSSSEFKLIESNEM